MITFCMSVSVGDLAVKLEFLYSLVYMNDCCIVCFAVSAGMCIVICDFDNVMALGI